MKWSDVIGKAVMAGVYAGVAEIGVMKVADKTTLYVALITGGIKGLIVALTTLQGEVVPAVQGTAAGAPAPKKSIQAWIKNSL